MWPGFIKRKMEERWKKDGRKMEERWRPVSHPTQAREGIVADFIKKLQIHELKRFRKDIHKSGRHTHTDASTTQAWKMRRCGDVNQCFYHASIPMLLPCEHTNASTHASMEDATVTKAGRHRILKRTEET